MFVLDGRGGIENSTLSFRAALLTYMNLLTECQRLGTPDDGSLWRGVSKHLLMVPCDQVYSRLDLPS